MTLKSLVGSQQDLKVAQQGTWFVQVLFRLPSPLLTRELNAVFCEGRQWQHKLAL